MEGKSFKDRKESLDFAQPGQISSSFDRSRERILQEIINNTFTHLVYLDSEFNFVIVNTTYAKTCKKSPEELIGKNHFYFFPNEENEEIFNRVKRTRKAESVHDKPFVFPDQPERGVTYWDWILSPVLDENNEVEGFVFALSDTTERKLVENALRRSEALLNASQKLSKVGGWEWDVKAKTMYWCEETYRIHGLSPNEILNNSSDLIPISLECYEPKDVPIILAAFRKCEKEGVSYDLEFPFTDKQGERKWIRTMGMASIEDGKIVYIVGNMMDITDRKKNEEALRLSEDKFAKAFYLSPDAININSLEDGTYIDVNYGFTSITGFTREEAIGHSSLPGDLGIWVNAEDRVRLLEGLKRNGEVIGLEAPFHKKDGSIIIGHLSAKIINIEDKPCLLSVTRDITERKQMENALRASEERFQSLVSLAPIGIYLTDADGKCLYANKQWCEMSGLSQEEAFGDGWVKGIHPEDRERVISAWQEMVESDGRWGMEYRFMTSDGKITWVLGIAATLQDNAKNISGYIGINLNITERREAQEVLANAAQRNRHIADVLQQALIPHDVYIQPPGYETTARYIPALSEAEVCGDFYDLFDLGDGRIGILIGDIVGKGLDAAVRIASVRFTIRSYAFVNYHPSEIITLVNDILSKEITSENDMLTVFFGILDTNTNKLKYTNAGHEPPLIMHKDKSSILLECGGPMFTGMNSYKYQEDDVDMQVEDVLVLVTDGITEARKNYRLELFGIDGVKLSLSKNLKYSADKIADALIADVNLFTDGATHDDKAIVVIKRLNFAELNIGANI